MKYDKRIARRIDVNLPVNWEGVFECAEATVTSLSTNGCFILSGGRVLPKELLRLEIHLPGDEIALVWAEVVDQAYEIGFAVRFTSGSDDADQMRLMKFVADTVNESEPSPA
jgi:hypothetical protein